MFQIFACSTVRYDTWSARHSIAYHAFFSFFLVLSVDESVLSHCQLSLFCYGDKTGVTLRWARRGEKELDQDQQNSLEEFFISFRCLLSCLIAICHSFISDHNCHNSLKIPNAWLWLKFGLEQNWMQGRLLLGSCVGESVWCIPIVNAWPVPFCKTWMRKIRIAIVLVDDVVLTKKMQ